MAKKPSGPIEVEAPKPNMRVKYQKNPDDGTPAGKEVRVFECLSIDHDDAIFKCRTSFGFAIGIVSVETI